MNRNYGIDALRIISMIMIVSLHVLGHGAILDSAMPLSERYEFFWFIEIMCYCAVNCYVLISGFVGFGSKHKFSNILILWLRVMIYSVAITIAIAIIFPGTVGAKDLLLSFIPVVTGKYWFFTAYFGLFLIMPALNYLVEKMPHKRMRVLLFLIVIFLSVIPTFRQNDIFGTLNGYSMMWFIVLYIVGAYLKKYKVHENAKRYTGIAAYVICVIITWGVKYLIEIAHSHNTETMFGENILVNYCSPTILGAAIGLVIFFSKINLNKLKKVIAFMSPLAFSVYLIHDNFMIRDRFIMGRFGVITTWSPQAMVVTFIIVVLIIFFACTAIDIPRELVFKKTKLKSKIQRLEEKLLDKEE